MPAAADTSATVGTGCARVAGGAGGASAYTTKPPKRATFCMASEGELDAKGPRKPRNARSRGAAQHPPITAFSVAPLRPITSRACVAACRRHSPATMSGVAPLKKEFIVTVERPACKGMPHACAAMCGGSPLRMVATQASDAPVAGARTGDDKRSGQHRKRKVEELGLKTAGDQLVRDAAAREQLPAAEARAHAVSHRGPRRCVPLCWRMPVQPRRGWILACKAG